MEKNKNFLEKIGSFFRKNTEVVKKFVSYRSYKASKYSNSNALWSRTTTTEDSDIYKSLTAMRARSRDLAQNNPIMKHYLVMLENNVVGKDGYKLAVLGQTPRGKLDIDNNLIVSSAWKDWSKKENCDISEKQNLTRMCATLVKTLTKDGEVLVKLVREKSNKRNKYGFKLQMLDAERLDVELSRDLDDGFIRMGVEMDLYGRPRAYWLRKFSVKDTSYMSGSLLTNNYERVSCDDLLHIFLIENAEQTRGVPWAHAVMIYMEDLDDFNEACLLAAKTGAASSIYLERDGNGKATDLGDEVDENGNVVAYMCAGEIRTLEPGLKLKSFNGQYPSDAYQVYTKRLLQFIAGGLGLSQVFLGNDTEDLNYSTARTVILEEHMYFETLQQFIIDNFLSKVYSEFLTQAYLNNKIAFKNITDESYTKFLNHAFIGRRWDGIDPAKEEEATTLAFQGYRKPLSTILAERGLDLSEVLAQYKQDAEIIKSILGDNFQLMSTAPKGEVSKEAPQEEKPAQNNDEENN